jgi:hypothetical protein
MRDRIFDLIAELHSDMTDAEFERRKNRIYEELDAII